MLIKWLTYAFWLAVISTVFLIVGCKTGLDIHRLPLADNILEDARTAFFESDRNGVINDFAQIDTGETTSDGFAIDAETDADVIMNEATGEKSRLFIQMPAIEARRDHILRALAAASIREDFKKGDWWNILVINTKALKSSVASYGFDDEKAKAYFLAMAEKINAKIADNDIIVVNLDDFSYGVTPDDFFGVLSKPHIVALSSQRIDTFKYFNEKPKSSEFEAKGLNPGHIYKLVKLRLARSKNFTDRAEHERIALMVAKLVTAIEPNGNLGSLVKCLTMIDSIVEGNAEGSDLNDMILKSIASSFQQNYDYLVELNLNSQTLTQIQQQVKENRLAFNEQARKTEEIRKSIQKVLKSSMLTLGDTIAKGFKTTKADMDDLRNFALPDLERSLVNSGDKNRDDIIGTTKLGIQRAISQLTKEGKAGQNETKDELIKKMTSLLDNAESTITAQAREQLEEVKTAFSDNVRNAIKRVLAENAAATSKAVRDSNDLTARLLQRAVDSVTSNADTSAQSLSQQASEVRDLVLSTARRLIENQRSTVADARTGITKHTDAAIKKAQQDLADALVQAEENIEKGVKTEGTITRGEVTRDVSQRVSSSTENAVTRLMRHGDDATKKIMAHASGSINDRIDDLEGRLPQRIGAETTDSIRGMNTDIRKEIASARSTLGNQIAQEHQATQRKILRHESELATATREEISDEIRQGAQSIIEDLRAGIIKQLDRLLISNTQNAKAVQASTEAVVKKEARLSREQIADAEKQINNAVALGLEHVNDEIQKLPQRNRRHTADLIRRFILKNFATPERYEIKNAIGMAVDEDEIRRRILSDMGAEKVKFNFFNYLTTAGPLTQTKTHRRYYRNGANAAQEWERFIREFRQQLLAGVETAPNPDIFVDDRAADDDHPSNALREPDEQDFKNFKDHDFREDAKD